MKNDTRNEDQGRVSSELKGGCLWITLHRPAKHNALSITLIDQLHDAIREAADMPSLRSLVLAGEGRSFCAGMDLAAAGDDPEAMAGMLRSLAEVMIKIRALPVPVIARVQGAAIGGGCGLLTVSDFVISHPEAKLGYPEVDHGICPAVVAPCLANSIGAGRARALLLAGGLINGRRGLEIGMVNTLVEAEDLDEAVDALVSRLETGGQQALRVTKHWLNTIEDPDLDAMFLKGADLSARILAGAEAQERLARRRG